MESQNSRTLCWCICQIDGIGFCQNWDDAWKLQAYTITTNIQQIWYHTCQWVHQARPHSSLLPFFSETAVTTSHRVVSLRTRSGAPLSKRSSSLDATEAVFLYWMRKYRKTALFIHSDTAQGNATSSHTRPTCISSFSSSNRWTFRIQSLVPSIGAEHLWWCTPCDDPDHTEAHERAENLKKCDPWWKFHTHIVCLFVCLFVLFVCWNKTQKAILRLPCL